MTGQSSVRPVFGISRQTFASIRSTLATIFIFQGLMLTPPSIANEDADRIVIASTETEIYISKGPSLEFSPLPLADVGKPVGVDYDGRINMVFWTDATEAAPAIKRAELDGTETIFVTYAGPNLNEIAIDENEDLIFWANAGDDSGALTRVNYDGTNKRRLRSNAPVHSVTLDKRRRIVYWSEGVCSLRRMTYDGSNLETLFSYDNESQRNNILAVSLNGDGSFVYWIERSYVYYIYSLVELDLMTNETRFIVSPRSVSISAEWFEGDLYYIQDTRTVNVNDLRYRRTRQQGTVGEDSDTVTDICAGRRQAIGVDGGRCTFERIACHWAFENSVTNTAKWMRWSTELATNRSVGPSTTADHTTRHYLLLNTDAEHNVPGETLILFSPIINASTTDTKCFRFAYYMFDVTNASLKVFFQHGDQTPSTSGHAAELSPLWTAYGSQVDQWMSTEIEVRETDMGRLVIEAVVGDPSKNTIAVDNLQYGKCHPDSRLVCDKSSMTVYLDRARLGISARDSVSLRDSQCHAAEFDEDTVSITTEYDRCGTEVAESNDVIQFFNQVYVLVQPGVRASNVSIRVNCTFGRNYHVGMTYLAHAWIKYISQDGFGNFSVGIRQYSNVNFQDAFSSSSFPQQVDVDDIIYMATEMVTIGEMVDNLHNARCWATPSPDRADPVSRDIIRDGCPAGNDVKVYSGLRTGLQPFSFRAFSFREGVNLIYAHCDVIICHDESACNVDCNHSRHSRETRSARDAGSGPYTVSQGPFVYKMGSSRKGDGAQMNTVLLTALVCTTVLLLASILVGAAIYMRLRKKMNNSFE